MTPNSYTRPVVDNQVKKPSITEQVKTLLRNTAPRWWSPYGVGLSIKARSTARRMREVIAADRDHKGLLHEYEEKWHRETVPCTDKDGEPIEVVLKSWKVYRWVGSADSPTLF